MVPGDRFCLGRIADLGLRRAVLEVSCCELLEFGAAYVVEDAAVNDLCAWSACSKDRGCLAHSTPARGGKQDDCFACQVVRLKECVDNRRRHVPPDGPLQAFFFRSYFTCSTSSSLQPQRAVAETGIFLTGHHPACFYFLRLSVAATNEQRRTGSPAHKNTLQIQKQNLEGIFRERKIARQRTVFFFREVLLYKLWPRMLF